MFPRLSSRTLWRQLTCTHNLISFFKMLLPAIPPHLCGALGRWHHRYNNRHRGHLPPKLVTRQLHLGFRPCRLWSLILFGLGFAQRPPHTHDHYTARSARQEYLRRDGVSSGLTGRLYKTVFTILIKSSTIYAASSLSFHGCWGSESYIADAFSAIHRD